MIGGPGLKENCTPKMNYFLINLKGMENRFSNVFFLCLVIWKKNNFVSKFWSQHRGAELGCQQIFLEIMTQYTRKVQNTRSQRFCWVSSMVYCFAIDCKNDSNKTKRTSYIPFPKDHMLSKEWLAKISRENAKPNFAHQWFCRALWTLYPHLKNWPFVFCHLFPAKP